MAGTIQKWEYKIISINLTSADLYRHDERNLNELGLQGWELISSTNTYAGSDRSARMVLLLKRAKIDHLY